MNMELQAAKWVLALEILNLMKEVQQLPGHWVARRDAEERKIARLKAELAALEQFERTQKLSQVS
jgi:hypothetical protein